MIDRRDEVKAIGAVVVLIAYDRPGLVASKILRGLDTPYPLLFDPERVAYRRWGLGRTNLLGAMLSPRLNWRYLRLLLRGERFLGFAPDMFQLGGDFVLDSRHRVRYVHRMRDNGDRPSVSRLLDELRGAAAGEPLPELPPARRS